MTNAQNQGIRNHGRGIEARGREIGDLDPDLAIGETNADAAAVETREEIIRKVSAPLDRDSLMKYLPV